MMMTQWSWDSFSLALPEAFLAVSGLLLLVLGAFQKKENILFISLGDFAAFAVYGYTRMFSKNSNLQAFINYDRVFDEDHNVKITMLYNRQSRTDAMSEQKIAENYRGYTAKINYNYKNKYLVDLNAAYNGTDRFGSNNRNGLFPALGLGWALSEEDFFKNALPMFELFKLRRSRDVERSWLMQRMNTRDRFMNR